MKSYGFFDGFGNSIRRGYQAWESEARRLAQRDANELGVAVEVVEEPCRYDYERDCPAEPVVVCEPE